MAPSYIAYYIFHTISIPFNCSYTALRIVEPMIGAKVKICVSPCLLCFSNLAPELVPRIFSLFSSQKPGFNFSYEPKAKFISITGPAWSTGLLLSVPKKQKKNLQVIKLKVEPSICHLTILNSFVLLLLLFFPSN